MDISSETKVGEIAAANPSATGVLEDAGVDYCCGGQESLSSSSRARWIWSRRWGLSDAVPR